MFFEEHIETTSFQEYTCNEKLFAYWWFRYGRENIHPTQPTEEPVMNNKPQSTNDPPDSLTKTGMKSYSLALLVSKIGCIGPVILILLGVSTAYLEKGDTSPTFDLLIILAIMFFIICAAIVLFTSLVGITHGILTFIEDKDNSEEIKNALTNNITVFLGVILVLLFAYRFLRNFW